MTHTQPENSVLPVKLTQRWIHDDRYTSDKGMRLFQIVSWYPENRHFLTPIQALYVRGVLSLSDMAVADNVYRNVEFTCDSVSIKTVFSRPLWSITSKYNEIMLEILNRVYFQHLQYDMTLLRVITQKAIKVSIDIGGGELVRTYARVHRVNMMYHVITCDGGFNSLCTFDTTRRCLQPCD